MAKLSSKNIGNMGMTFGIADVTPNDAIAKYNEELFRNKNKETQDLIVEFLN